MWRRSRHIATLLTMPAPRSSALRCASVVLALVLLTGCTAEPAPAPTAPATTAATTTPGASPSAPTAAAPTEPAIEKITTPPAVPIDLTTPGKVGSKAAVKYFMALYGYALNTGDTTQLRAASAPACAYCTDLARNIESHYAEMTQVAGGDVAVKKIRLHEPESTENEHLWLMHVVFSPSRDVAKDGSVTEKLDPRDDLMGLTALWDGDLWRVGGYYDVTDDTDVER